LSRRIQVVFFAIGLGFFAWLVAHIGVRTIVSEVARTGWVFLPIVLVYGVVYATNTVAWMVIAHARGRLSFGRAYAISVSSFAINYITPLVNLGGEPFKAAAATPYLGASTAAASVVAFRIVHSLGQFIFWLMTLPIAYVLLPHTPTILTMLVVAAGGLVIGAFLLVMLLRARAVEPVLGTIADRSTRIPLIGRAARGIARRRAALAEVDAGLAQLANERRGALAVALAAEVAGRFIAMYEYLLVAHAVGANINYPAAVLIGGFSQLVLNLFFFVPFEMGSREGGLYLIFQLLGFSPALGVYAAIVTRLRELAWIAIGLGLIWLTGAGREAERRG
jgi:uncharacterized membrane protein YbhN (UPF0104 family)